MNTTLSCPYPTVPIFVICMKNDGRQLRSFFANSRYIFDAGCILPSIEALVTPFEPAVSQTSEPRSDETQPTILALEAYLGRILNGEKEFACFTISYDDIRQFSLLSNYAYPEHAAPIFVDWLVQNQFPVVHLVRKNPLDCFVQELVSDQKTIEEERVSLIDLKSAVENIRQMQSDVEQFRNWLVTTNRVEFYSEMLVDHDHRPSPLVVHQLGRHLGANGSIVEPPIPLPRIESNDMLASQIKSQLRPALIRAGYENLYELPRAA